MTNLIEQAVNDKFVVRGKAAYAIVHTPQDSNNGKSKEFRVTLVFKDLEDEGAQTVQAYIKKYKLKNQLIDFEDKDPGLPSTAELLKLGRYGITLRRRAWLDEAGGIQNPLTVINEDGSPVTLSTLIGNGSDVSLSIGFRKYTIPDTKKEGLTLQLRAVQVHKLVEYKKKSTQDFASDFAGVKVAAPSANVSDDVPF